MVGNMVGMMEWLCVVCSVWGVRRMLVVFM